VPVASPTFSPAGGPYPEPLSVTLGCSTPGALIRYTLDGSNPSSSSGNLYTGALHVGPIGSLRAIAYKAGRTDSPVAIAGYSVQSAIVGTLAGFAGAIGYTDGSTGTARFNRPEGLACDGSTVYVADAGNNAIRSISLSSSTVSTLAAGFNSPGAVYLSVDGSSLYVSDTLDQVIQKIVIATNEVTVIAGTYGTQGSADGAAGTFYDPRGLASDGSYLYIADQDNHTIRRLRLSDMTLSTVAGSAGIPGSTDGSAALFNRPDSLALAGGSLYVTDSNNYTVRRIDLGTGVVSTLAGLAGSKGSADGIGSAASFLLPRGLATDGVNLFVSDSDNRTIRKIVLATGEVTTIAGKTGFAGSTDGVGSVARFARPYGLACYGNTLYAADANATIRSLW
jgi:hypothetical protein